MNIKLIIKFALFSFLILFLNGCASGKLGKSKPFKHNTPLIKDDVRKSGKIEVLTCLTSLTKFNEFD